MQEQNKKIKKTEVVKKIEKVIEILDEVDEYFNELPNMQQNIDYKLSDLFHYIQERKIVGENGAKNMWQILKEHRLERKNLNYDRGIKAFYNDNKKKLLDMDNRKFFKNDLYQRIKNLTEEYKYRVYSEEDIKTMLKNGKLKEEGVLESEKNKEELF